jgi:hypothetical protein
MHKSVYPEVHTYLTAPGGGGEAFPWWAEEWRSKKNVELMLIIKRSYLIPNKQCTSKGM